MVGNNSKKANHVLKLILKNMITIMITMSTSVKKFINFIIKIFKFLHCDVSHGYNSHAFPSQKT